MRWICPALLAIACSGDPKTTDTGPADTGSAATSDTDTDTDTDTQGTTDTDGACGAVTRHDLTLLGAVVLASGGPAVGASVWIEDRAWAVQTETLGTATTDDDGLFTLPITGLTSVEDCWGSALDYVVVAELGIQRGERDVNAPLYNVILAGGDTADITASPIEMIDTSL
ncbi:MAG: carboxypeptidase-like regulatory domain-containing protein [Myxococcota bacterium]